MSPRAPITTGIVSVFMPHILVIIIIIIIIITIIIIILLLSALFIFLHHVSKTVNALILLPH